MLQNAPHYFEADRLPAVERREKKWLDDWLARGRREMFSVIGTITPYIAGKLLEVNVDNRRLNQRLVDTIAADIRDNLWQVNGETIIISADGQVNDGQHRLWACLQAGLPFVTNITFGASRESRLTVDQGRARTVGDFLSMEGTPSGTNLAGAARLLLMFEQGVYHAMGNDSRFSKQAVLRAFYDNKDEIERALHAVDRMRQGRRTAPVIIAYLLCARSHAMAADLFFARVGGDGSNLKPGDPALFLRDHLRDSARLKGMEKLELILRYWNAWREGRSIARRISCLSQLPKGIR